MSIFLYLTKFQPRARGSIRPYIFKWLKVLLNLNTDKDIATGDTLANVILALTLKTRFFVVKMCYDDSFVF